MLGYIAPLHLALAPDSTYLQQKRDRLGTTTQPDRAVASQSHRVASDHQGTVVSLPAGVRGSGQVTLPFPHPPVTGDISPRTLSSLWGSMQRPKGCAMSCLPHPAPSSGVQRRQIPYIHLRDPCDVYRLGKQRAGNSW